MGWGTALDILLRLLPVQGRVERWKNEIDSLTKEKEKLLKGQCNEKRSQRILWINNRLDTLNKLLRNQS